MKVAIIGCGGMGRLHAAMATNCGLGIAVCADAVKKAAQDLAGAYGAKAVTDWQKAIDHPDADIVLITTPTPTHAPLVRAAAKAGKHIFCEKPFCRTVADCRAVIAAVEKAGVKLFVGHVVRYFHEFEALKAQVDAGNIGRPGFAKLYRGGLFPAGAKRWFSDFVQSGGVTFDSMIHDLDWLRYAFGEPERIFCQTIMYGGHEAMDYSQVTMRMKSGLIAAVIGTWAHPSGFRVKAEICGSGGMVQFDSAEAPVAVLKRDAGQGPGMIVPESPVGKSPYQFEWEDFVGWLDGRHPPKVTAHDALRAVEMVSAALESAKSGRPVNL
jgi:predicted dehydrogenase